MRVCVISFTLVLILALAAIGQVTQLPDSLPADTLLFRLDSTALAPDSAAAGLTLRERWLFPLGFMLAAAAGFVALFAVRSR